MTDLVTPYLGLLLKNPIVASSSPLTEKLDNVRRLEDAGVSAIVFHSLFEEQLEREGWRLHNDPARGAERYAESLDFLPDFEGGNHDPERYLEHIAAAKRTVSVPIIASLNGVTPGGWASFAKLIEEAGADALELNVYDLPVDPNVTGAQIEEGCVRLTRMVKAQVRLPVAIKLSPFFSSIPNMARRLDEAGADGLVLFNRFYQPDLDIEALEITPSLDLSHAHELRLRLRWLAILYGELEADLAATGGVHTAADAVKAIMAGANAAMMTSALLRHGIDHIRSVLSDMQTWMAEREYGSVEEMRGCLSRRCAARADAFERANYMKTLTAFSQNPPT